MKNCDLCQGELDDGYFRLAGLSVCGYCHGGMLSAAWEKLGFDGDATHTQKTVRSNDRSYTVLESMISIRLPENAPFGASFSRQWSPSRFLKWLGLGKGSDLEVGEPLFDDAVEITGDGPALRRWLSDEGVQTAIMNIVASDHTGSVVVAEEVLQVTAQSTEVQNTGELEALATALAATLVRSQNPAW